MGLCYLQTEELYSDPASGMSHEEGAHHEEGERERPQCKQPTERGAKWEQGLIPSPGHKEAHLQVSGTPLHFFETQLWGRGEPIFQELHYQMTLKLHHKVYPVIE